MKALGVLSLVLCVVLGGCGEFFPLDEDPTPNVRIAKFEPSPVSPKYDSQMGVVYPPTTVFVRNYSHVPVTFTEFEIHYFEAVKDAQGRYPEMTDLRTFGGFHLHCPPVATPYQFQPDSVGPRVIYTEAYTSILILTPAAYQRASGGTPSFQDLTDDKTMFAVVKLIGQTDSGVRAEVEGSVPLTALLQK